MNTLMTGAWLAQDPPTGPQGPEFGGSSPLGLLVTLLMLIAVVLLVRSMNRHLRKLPKSFDEPDEAKVGDTTSDAEQKK
ncbi:hypothetical protein [Pseudonocardia spinosispora]|uniref:hypothetical protein n=1 Tax=Pseudonocardia spinosispora TaxID=103441 RepID=UPI00048C6084